ncbi:MAG: tetratricopeptide repeat protein [Planctomycetaceae bacterium]
MSEAPGSPSATVPCRPLVSLPVAGPPEFISGEDLRRFMRFLDRTLGTRFRLAIIETPSLQAQTDALNWLCTELTRREAPLFELNLHKLWKPQQQWPEGTANLWKTLHREIDPACVANHRAVIVVRGLENFQDITGRAWWDVAAQVNIQRDLYVRDYPCWWILLLHPTSRQHWQKVAPDFCDFVSVWTHAATAPAELPETASESSHTADIEFLPREAGSSDWPLLLLDSLRHLQMGQLDKAFDSLYSFRASTSIGQHHKAISTILEAMIREQRGETAAATRLLTDSAIPQLRNLVRHEQSQQVLPDLAWALCSLARLTQACGDLESARTLLAEGHTYWTQLHAQDHEDARVRVELANSLERLADIARTSGQLNEARVTLDHALLLREQLIAQFRLQPEYEMAIVGTYHLLSVISLTMGAPGKAREWAERALEIAARTAELLPQNLDASRNHAVQCEQLGDVLMVSGDASSAQPFFLQATEIHRRLVTQSPESVHYSRNLCTNLIKLADVARWRQEFKQALQQLEEAAQICAKLADAAPGDAVHIRDFSVCLERLGDLYMAIGNAHQAGLCHEKSLELSQRLTELSPRNAEFARDLGISLNKLADLLLADGDPAAARELYERALKIREKLSAAAPENALVAKDLWISCLKLARLHDSRNQPELASSLIRRATQMLSNSPQLSLLLSPADRGVLETLLGSAHVTAGSVL